MKNSGVKIYSALAYTPPSPCEVFRCQHYARCGSELLSCKAFNNYVKTGLVVAPGLPTRKKYNAIMRGGISG